MVFSKRKQTILEGVKYLNTLFGYSDPVPDAPTTRTHRLNDKPSAKSYVNQKAVGIDYKKAVFDFIIRNPRCGAKQISAGLKIPHASVQAILTKASIAGSVMRSALHEQRGCRPIYIYWIQE